MPQDLAVKYRGLPVYRFYGDQIESWGMKESLCDRENLWVYYEGQDDYAIKFYPFRYKYGNGNPYIIRLGIQEPYDWQANNPNFESDIRQKIEALSERNQVNRTINVFEKSARIQGIILIITLILMLLILLLK